MSKKVKFTINGLVQAECDKFVVMKLANPKKSNTLLFRVVRPAIGLIDPPIEPTKHKYIIVECPTGQGSGISADVAFIEASSVEYAEHLMGILDNTDRTERWPMEKSGNKWVTSNEIDATVATATRWTADPIELDKCNFYAFVTITTAHLTYYFKSSEIDGTKLTDAGIWTIHANEGWIPSATI